MAEDSLEAPPLEIGPLEIAVVGAGYVGLTTAACLAHLGHRIACFDSDSAKVDDLRRGRVGIREDGLASLVADGLAEGRLSFHSSIDQIATAVVVMLCLPTPQSAGGGADLTVLLTALEGLSPVLPRPCVLVIKSTVPVGTCARIARMLGGGAVEVVSNPEFLREGMAVRDFLSPDRIVIGSASERAGRDLARVYAAIDAPIVRTDLASAELAKYASNAFLAVKGSYVNELASLCESVGAEIEDVATAVGLDPRIGPAFLRPGPGWGGSCLPKDTEALLATAAEHGADLSVVAAAVESNGAQRNRMVEKIGREASGGESGSVAGLRLGLLGLTFKAGTDDLRDSPALAVAGELARRGAHLAAYDPEVPAHTDCGIPGLDVVGEPLQAAAGVDAIIVLTEWPQFRDIDWSELASAASRACCVDTRNLLDEKQLVNAGFCYHRLGSGQRSRSA